MSLWKGELLCCKGEMPNAAAMNGTGVGVSALRLTHMC